MHLQLLEDTIHSRWMPKGGHEWETHSGAGSWQDLWPYGERRPLCSRSAGRTCGGPVLEQAVPEELDPFGRDTH